MIRKNIFFKKDKPVKNKLVKFLYSENRDEVIKAVNKLIQGQKTDEIEQDLLLILENWRSDESYVSLWSIIALGYWSSLSAIPFLLDVLDSEADIWKEAALEALERIAEEHGELILDPIEEFIEKRLDHDPFDARLFAYGPVAVLTQSERAKSFLIRMFEVDDTWQEPIAYDIIKFGDKRILQLLRRAIEYAHKIKDDMSERGLRDAYCILAGAYEQDNYDLRNKPWEKRWADKLDELGKSEEEIEKMYDDRFSKKQDINNKTRIEDEEWYKKNKRQNKIRDTYDLGDFNLDEYLEIRYRNWIEQDFHSALRLSGLSDLYNVEEVQKIINNSLNLASAIGEVLGDYEFPSEDGTEEFMLKFQELWNNTPREEFQGLTPNEMFEVNSGQKVGRNDPCPCGATKPDGTPVKFGG